MKQKNLLLTAFCLLVFTSTWAQTATHPSGSGTNNNPYQIASMENLYWLSQTDSIWEESLYFKQTANINASETSTWNNEEGFSPIGNKTTKFTGHYNGAGFTINNLTINRPTTEDIGLFGYLNHATIENLGLTNVDIQGRNHVSGLAGYSLSSTVKNCYSTGSISGNYSIGGLVGGNESLSSVINSYSTGSISGNFSIGGLVGVNESLSSVINSYSIGSISGRDNAGGLVGYNTSSVSNSYYNSQTSGKAFGIGSDRNNQTVKDLTTTQMKQSSKFIDWDFAKTWKLTENITFPCLANVSNVPIILPMRSLFIKTNETYTDTIKVVYMDNQSVSIKLSSAPEGMTLTQDSIIRWTPTKLDNYDIKIIASDASGLQTIYSYTLKVTNLSGQGTINNPLKITSLEDLRMLSNPSSLWTQNYYFEQTANIDASQTNSWNEGKGFSPIGNDITKFNGHYNGTGFTINNLTINRPTTKNIGLFGYLNYATIDNLGLNNVNIQANNNSGGLVGYSTASTVNNCYSTGSVSGNFYIGGLVGYSTSSTVNNSYSTGLVSGSSRVGGLVGYSTSSTVNNCYSTGDISGNSNIGGLVGYSTASTVNNSYSTGDISGNSNIGVLVGYNSISPRIINSYYNSETSGKTSGIGHNENNQTVTALTTTEMKQSSNFSSWDFTDTWAIKADSTYPALLGVSNNAPFAFPDTLSVAKTRSLLTNDYDYETGQEALICKLKGISTKGSLSSNGTYSFNTNTSIGTKDTITYCVGELLASADTLWGNYTDAILTKVDKNTPVLISVRDTSISENTSLTLSLNDVSVSNVDGNDVLSLFILAGKNYNVNDHKITPATGYNGILTIPVYVSNGTLNSDTLNMAITVLESTAITKLSTKKISVYPNPITTVINVKGSNGIASLYNLAGCKVIIQDLSQSNSINISALPSGLYMLSVDGITIKVIKK